jgi:plasmid stability protein
MKIGCKFMKSLVILMLFGKTPEADLEGDSIRMATLQVKGIDDALYKALGARAAMENRSLSQEVVTMIQEFLARPRRDPGAATRAFLALAGSWSDPRAAKRIAEELRRSRRSKRRPPGRADVFA